jgi:hypothetical protein
VESLPVPGGKPQPGEDWQLTPQQLEFGELMMAGRVNMVETAEHFRVCDRTLRNWRALPEFRRYLRHLANVAIGEIRARFAEEGLELAEHVIRVAKGEARPSSPYSDRYASLVLSQLVSPRPAEKTVGIELKSGDKTIRVLVAPGAAWSGESWRQDEPHEAQDEERAGFRRGVAIRTELQD